MKGGQCNVCLAPLDPANKSAMKTRFVGERLLRGNFSLEPEFPNALAKPSCQPVHNQIIMRCALYDDSVEVALPPHPAVARRRMAAIWPIPCLTEVARFEPSGGRADR